MFGYRNNLRQTFEVTRHIYNIADLENDVLAVVLKINEKY